MLNIAEKLRPTDFYNKCIWWEWLQIWFIYENSPVVLLQFHVVSIAHFMITFLVLLLWQWKLVHEITSTVTCACCGCNEDSHHFLLLLILLYKFSQMIHLVHITYFSSFRYSIMTTTCKNNHLVPQMKERLSQSGDSNLNICAKLSITDCFGAVLLRKHLRKIWRQNMAT